MPSRRSITGAAAMAAVATSLAPAAPGEAKVEFGIQVVRQTAGYLNVAEAQRMQAGKAAILRTSFDWSVAEPTPTLGFDFTELDALMTRVSSGRRIEVLPVLYSSPSWISPKMPGDPPVGGAELDRWAAFVRAVIARYGRNGTFWSTTPGVAYNPIRALQVWNEPNLLNYWTNMKPNAKEYAKFLQFTHRVIRSADKKAKTVVAAMPERQDAPRSMADFLKKLYKAKGFKGSFDVIAMNPFGPDDRSIEQAIAGIRDIVDGEGQKKVPLWITEIGFASAGPKTPFTKGPKGQAKLLTKTFDRLKRQARKLRIGKVFWYSWRDIDTIPPQNPGFNTWQTYTGLFTKGGAPKRSWSAFAKFTGGSAGSGPIP
jgi:polysaccharide biosynthesis protein PslG